MNKVSVVDFGAGNLGSVCRALDHLGRDVTLASTADGILSADRLILPGVGAFGACMQSLARHALVDAVRAFAATGRPMLGICVGMQMLFDESLEFGSHQGLGLVSGKVIGIPATSPDNRTSRRIPHVGWAPLTVNDDKSGLFTGIMPGESVYFVHSFMGVPADPAHILAQCEYDGQDIVAAVQRDNIIGVQFHPEKSGRVGLSILDNFLKAGQL